MHGETGTFDSGYANIDTKKQSYNACRQPEYFATLIKIHGFITSAKIVTVQVKHYKIKKNLNAAKTTFSGIKM